MSNLGWYQVITTWSKKVGGPLNLLGIVAGVGAIGGVAGTKGVEALVGSQKKKAAEKEKAAELLKTYTVSKEGVSNEGLQFHVGETFKVLERDGNAVLIEELGDDNNPYFVAAELLNEISDYK